MFGLLRCRCGVFPVVDGIPVLQREYVGMFEHTTGEAQVAGVAVAELVRLIETGRSLEALLECLVVPALPSTARHVLPWRVANSGAGRRVARSIGKRRFRRDVLARRGVIGADDLFRFFYRPGWPLGSGVGQYFTLRFAQPRYLAALALLATIPARTRPVLDIACGAGHFEHYLTQRNDPVAVVGTDMNFFQLWIAQHWIAPASRFVCANARDGLPFVDEAFSATVCSDAYHYIGNRRTLQQEIRRCAPGQPVLLTRVGNRSVMPNEGIEQSVEEYLDEFSATDVRSFSEAELLKCYLRRTIPFKQAPNDPARLSESKWLSFVWNVAGLRQDGGWERDAWPHAVGQIGINPLYSSAPGPDGSLSLRFEFPSAWYAYENHDMLSYHPRTATISRDQLTRLSAWRSDPSLSALVEAFVLIGLPDRFMAARSHVARERS